MEGEIDHFLYPKATKEEADAAAWVATTPQGKLSLYYFKFMDMEENDVRVKVLYTSICQSDILTVREKWGTLNFYYRTMQLSLLCRTLNNCSSH